MFGFSGQPTGGRMRLVISPHIPTNYFMDWFRTRVEPIKNQPDKDAQRYAETIKVNLHYSEKKYLTEFITDREIDFWDSERPIFISAQTGTGKNYFVQHQLLRHLYEKNQRTGRNDKILILSNRIALGRQSKQDFAENIARIIGNSSFLKEMKKYTPEGLDEFTDFGIVQLYSYQAFLNSNAFSNHNFKYIVCDECHFFTSDGLFNPNTDVIMNKIIDGGRNAVRIYMSATPEVVFAPIVLEEYYYVENVLNQEKNDSLKLLNHRQNFETLAMYQLGNPEFESNYYNIEAEKERIIQQVPNLEIEFYYMERNYDYIDNVYYYTDDDELLKEVVKADEDNKWLIFVSSKRHGNSLLEKIKEETDKNSVTFLTAESKSLSDSPTAKEIQEKATYEKLVNEQTFDENVLITTSVLDNGVNIKAESIKNVVIDYCDRTEFIQMLGRLRTTSDTKINLYVPQYSEEQIQRKLKRNIQSLVDRLIFDIADVNFKQNKFDKRLHRFTYDGDATYNANAIWQLIESINFQMSLMKASDPNFNLDTLIGALELKNPIDFSSSCRKIYNDYMNKGHGVLWSRNIVDILTTAADIKQRADWTKEDENLNEYGNRYAFRFDDNFAKYLFEKIIPKSFDDVIKEKIQSTLSRLKNHELNSYHWYKQQHYGNKTLSPYEDFQILAKFFQRYDCDISTEREEKLYRKGEYYRQLATTDFRTDLEFGDMLLNEQMKWLEKSIADCKPIPTELQNSNVHDLREYIIENAVTLKEIENQKSGNYVDKNYLQKIGIPHDEKNPTNEEQTFCDKFRNGTPFNRSEVNKMYFKTDKYEYWLNSYNATGNRKTYYVFVKIENE